MATLSESLVQKRLAGDDQPHHSKKLAAKASKRCKVSDFEPTEAYCKKRPASKEDVERASLKRPAAAAGPFGRNFPDGDDIKKALEAAAEQKRAETSGQRGLRKAQSSPASSLASESLPKLPKPKKTDSLLLKSAIECMKLMTAEERQLFQAHMEHIDKVLSSSSSCSGTEVAWPALAALAKLADAEIDHKWSCDNVVLKRKWICEVVGQGLAG